MDKPRAIFLDRDGVINVNRVENVRSWEQFVFEQGSLEALGRLGATDFRLLVVTNQSGIARGHMTQATVDEIHARMTAELAHAGARIERVYFCPHSKESDCACRKPAPGMIYQGRDEFGLDLAGSYFIGDWIDDVRAARAAGVIPLLVRTGRGEAAVAEMRASGIVLPEILDNLSAAVNWILEREYAPAAELATTGAPTGNS